MINQKEQYPVENHVGYPGNSITEELDCHVFTKGRIKEINEVTNVQPYMFE
jgi:hypothetical protein